MLTRVAGAFIFVPLPGMKRGPEMARIVLALSFTVALFPLWPPQDISDPDIGRSLAGCSAEAALGITIGLAVAFVPRRSSVAAQIVGLQAGYAYASTIDPTTQADSGVLVVFAQLTAGCCSSPWASTAK